MFPLLHLILVLFCFLFLLTILAFNFTRFLNLFKVLIFFNKLNFRIVSNLQKSYKDGPESSYMYRGETLFSFLLTSYISVFTFVATKNHH